MESLKIMSSMDLFFIGIILMNKLSLGLRLY